MDYFTPIDGSVLLRSGGIFSEHQVYRNHKKELFARKGNGYLRLMDHHGTSKERVFWDEVSLPIATEFLYGRLMIKTATKHLKTA